MGAQFIRQTTARVGSPYFDTNRKRWNRRAGSKALSEVILTAKLFQRDLKGRRGVMDMVST
ncbi:hypothetical protein DPMN_187550 [Dreissena polymorpha]|uniref:Uncharacterized protein n=1 Tax=Dreissena polymorpha TaxID=45954 RepID=A0A9D4DP96_DREPO|nr:hypothetical protein DPMN_187550 [Dreissena polymorpha]